MSETGDAEATGGLTVADAAAVFETLLADDGDSEGQEPLEEETPQAEEDAEPEGDAEPEEQSEEGDDTPDSEEQPTTYRVKVAGEEVEVPLSELIKGYAREGDYTRKTMALGEQAKALQTDRQALDADRERTTNLLKALEDSFQAPTHSQEQLDWLRSNNPGEFAAVVAEQMQRGQYAQAAKAERERIALQAQTEQHKAAQVKRDEELAKLFAQRPEWRDEAKGKPELDKAKAYATTLGVTDEEWSTALANDHRLIIALNDAAKWRDLQGKKPAVKAKVEQVKTAKPGTSAQKPGKVTEVTRAQQRLAKTGRVEDAAAVFLKMQE